MITDNELKIKGINILVKELGEVMAEKFISLVNREPFDYTRWQNRLFRNTEVSTLSKSAMNYRNRKSAK